MWLREHGVEVEEAARPSAHAGPTTERRASPSRRSSSAGRAVSERSDSVGDISDADPDADPEVLARTVVLRKLSAQARTRHELEQALVAKQVPVEAAEVVLDRLADVGLVDDEKFARDWVSSRQERRQLSRTALRRELSAKGVDRAVVDEALAETAVEDESELAAALARRKLRTMTGLSREVRARRLAGVLARRGFSSGTIARTLDAVLDDSGLDLSLD